MSRNLDEPMEKIMGKIREHKRVFGLLGLLTAAQFSGVLCANHTPYRYRYGCAYAQEMSRPSEEDVKWQNAFLESINSRIDREKMNAYIDRVHKDAEEMLKVGGYNVDLSIPCASSKRSNKQKFGEEVAVYSYWNEIIEPGEKAVWIGSRCLVILPEKPEMGEPRLQIYTGGYSPERKKKITDTVNDIYSKLDTLIGTAYASMIYGIPQEELFRIEPPSSGARVSKGNVFGDSPEAKRAGAIGQVIDNVLKRRKNPEVVLVNDKGEKILIRPSRYRNHPDLYKGVEILYQTDAGRNK